eukprot:EG_transcript_13395
MSCADLSSNCISVEESLGSTSTASSYVSGEEPETPQTPDTASTVPRLAPTSSWYAQTIQEELRAVLAAFPNAAPPSAVCHALGYVLQTKWKWAVKFCCQGRPARLPNTVPRSWLDDVMVVQPAPHTHCLVDVQFRDKFLARCPGPLGGEYIAHVMQHVPCCYVGTLHELCRDVDLLAGALEAVFRESGTLLPPWRSKNIFRFLYKHCVEHDATDSQDCLHWMGEQVAASKSRDGFAHCMHCAKKAAHPLSVAALQRVAAGPCAVPPAADSVTGPAEDAAVAGAGVDLEFEKAATPTSSAEAVHSGLSFLLRGREVR